MDLPFWKFTKRGRRCGSKKRDPERSPLHLDLETSFREIVIWFKSEGQKNYKIYITKNYNMDIKKIKDLASASVFFNINNF